MSNSLTKLYQVPNSDQEVKLAVRIGHAQLGMTTVSLGTRQLASNHRGTLEVTVGKGADLNGAQLFCVTTVTDVRTETNQTSVTYELQGGTHTFQETLQETVSNEGDVVFYTAVFHFHH